jgi:hypothetical protein
MSVPALEFSANGPIEPELLHWAAKTSMRTDYLYRYEQFAFGVILNLVILVDVIYAEMSVVKSRWRLVPR